MPATPATRSLGRTGLHVSPIGFGAFKIGRNTKTKYPQAYDLPDDQAVVRLLDELPGLGINLIDTAPSYGVSEERLGRHLAGRWHEFVLCTKTGERFESGESVWEYSRDAILRSVEQSCHRLRTDVLDILLIHSNGTDLEILQHSDAAATLLELKEQGVVRAVGFSGKTAQGAMLALEWADVLMVEYHLNDTSHQPVLEEAARRGTGVLIKKGLAAGHLSPEEAIPFVLEQAGVHSLVLGGLNPEHMRANVRTAAAVRDRKSAA